MITEVQGSKVVLQKAEQQVVDLRLLLRTLRELTEVKELTPTLVNSLIERIEVHNNDKSSGHCYVKVDIYFTAAGMIDIPEGDLNMVRFGVTMYGMYPTDDVTKEKLPVTPAMELKAHITHVKTLPKGVGIGYSSTYITEKEIAFFIIRNVSNNVVDN